MYPTKVLGQLCELSEFDRGDYIKDTDETHAPSLSLHPCLEPLHGEGEVEDRYATGEMISPAHRQRLAVKVKAHQSSFMATTPRLPPKSHK